MRLPASGVLHNCSGHFRCAKVVIVKRKRWIIGMLLSAVAIVGWFLLSPNNHARSKAERLARVLAKEGFKTELSQFDSRTAPELAARSEKLLETSKVLQDVFPARAQGFFRPVGSNAAAMLS